MAHNTFTQRHLNGLTLMYIHNDIFKNQNSTVTLETIKLFVIEHKVQLLFLMIT